MIYQWRRSVCPQPSTDRGAGVLPASEGQVDVVMAMFFFLLVLLVAIFQFKSFTYMVSGAYVEDALAAAGLASALIDVEEYGKTHNILITDTQKAYGTYRDALYYNLALDEAGYSSRTELLAGKVELREYIIYNVLGQEIQITGYDGQGNCLRRYSALLGTVLTPDGVPVQHTTVYSRVGFQVTGLEGSVIEAEKEKSVDIVRYEGGE